MSSSLSIKTPPAHLIYDLSSPYFVSSEITTIFSPAPIAADLTSRISDITYSDGFRMEELRRRVTGFGKLFAVDVVIVASMGFRGPVGGG
jgi:hypothetical protein